jgi:hypothetical protein
VLLKLYLPVSPGVAVGLTSVGIWQVPLPYQLLLTQMSPVGHGLINGMVEHVFPVVWPCDGLGFGTRFDDGVLVGSGSGVAPIAVTALQTSEARLILNSWAPLLGHCKQLILPGTGVTV